MFNTDNDGFWGGACGPAQARNGNHNTAIGPQLCRLLGLPSLAADGKCAGNGGYSGTEPLAACGRMLRVTNLETARTVDVMIVDNRDASHGLDLSATAWTAIGGLPAGGPRGFIDVQVQLVA